eukprot:1188122-Prorocentrum_minimum.AAC.2
MPDFAETGREGTFGTLSSGARSPGPDKLDERENRSAGPCWPSGTSSQAAVKGGRPSSVTTCLDEAFVRKFVFVAEMSAA